jgi:hypothetical protein
MRFSENQRHNLVAILIFSFPWMEICLLCFMMKMILSVEIFLYVVDKQLRFMLEIDLLSS